MALACGDGLVRILRYNFLSICNLINVCKRYLNTPDLREIAYKGEGCLEFSLGKRFPVDQVRILGIGLELAWNGDSCGGMSLKRD